MHALLNSAWPEMGAPVTASNPYVEANLMQTAKGGTCLAVVNYSGAPIPALQLTVDKAAAANPSGARAEFCEAAVTDRDNTLRIVFPIDRFEFITLTR